MSNITNGTGAKFCILLSSKNEFKSAVEEENNTYYASLNINFAHGGSLPFSNTKKITCSPQSVSYHKKVYQPTYLEVILSATITESDKTDEVIKNYSDLFLGKKISIIEDKTDSDSANASDPYYAIKEFDICAVIPREEVSTTPKLTFKIIAFSPEKVLDMNPYCETFYATTLGKILEKITKIKYNYSKNLFVGTVELNQPYLVQYNETFYQFLVRIANRCGMYVFFEEEELHIGVRSGKNYNKSELPTSVIEYPSYFNYGEFINTGSFSGDYCPVPEKAGTPSVNNEIVDNSQAYKIIHKDNYTAEGQVITDGIMTVSSLGDIVQQGSVPDVLFTTVATPSILATNRSKINKDLIADFKHKDSPAVLHNQTLPIDDSKAYPSEDDESENTVLSPLKSKWYENIEAEQKKAENNKRIITFEKHPNQFLMGDTFNNTHTVIEIKADWSYEMQQTGGGDFGPGHAVPVMTNKHTITAIEKDKTPYLGERRIRRATPHTATVAQVNDPLRIGRIRVKFPWDSSETLSPWIRVSTAAAYKDGGILFTPEVNDEAMIDFVDGNIERPFVIGFMHSKDKKPYIGSRGYNKRASMYTTLDKDRTKNNDYKSCTIANRTGQSITLENGANANNFFKDFAGPMKAVVVGGGKINENNQLGGCITLSDAYGVCTIKSDTGGRCITLNSALGKIKMSAFDGITIDCPNGDVKIKGKNISLEAGNNITIKSGENRGWVGWATMGETLGKNIASKSIQGIDAAIAYESGSTLIKGFLDLSYIRAILEVILRPIEGTTLLKTKGNMILSNAKGVSNDKAPNFKRRAGAAKDWGKLFKKNVYDGKYDDDNQESEFSRTFFGAGIGGIVDDLLTEVGLGSVEDFLMGTGYEYFINSEKNRVCGYKDKSGIYISTGSENLCTIKEGENKIQVQVPAPPKEPKKKVQEEDDEINLE